MLKKVLKLFFRGNTINSILLIIVGTVTWSLTMVKSGIVYDYGMGFWGPNGHDGVWHIALIKSLANGSWNMPMFAGEQLKNYHVGFDFLLAMLSSLTGVTPVRLYFQVIPPILAFLIGIFAYKFVYIWRRSRLQAFWATFFVYFGGSFGWIITWIRNREFGGESLFWSQQSISTLVNPPFALSILLMFVGLNFLIKGLRRQRRRSKTPREWLKSLFRDGTRERELMIATFIFGILIQVKVYAGILSLGGLFVIGIWRMLQRKGISLMKVFSGALIVSILLFSPLNKSAEQTIIFKPFWFLETMMGFQDRVGWTKFGEAMVNYKLGGVWIKGVVAYTAAFIIFLLGNLGIRVIGGIWVIRKMREIRKINYIDLFILTVIVSGIILPMLFVQSGTAWNTIQFFYYSLVFLGVLAGLIVGDLLERLKRESSTVVQATVLTIMFFIVLFSLPSLTATLRHYLPSRPPAMISKEELKALDFLSNQPRGVVLTMPFDKAAADAAIDNPPRPLYLYESTAYVSAFSGQQVYMEDEVNLEITGYDWRGRREEVIKLLDDQDVEKASEFIKKNDIDYVYWVKESDKGELWEDKNLEKIFKNDEVNIYKAD